MTALSQCPECGCDVPADADTLGLCPACLIRRVWHDTQQEAKKSTLADAEALQFTPPDVEQLTAGLADLDDLQLIALGGMGAVYRARQRRLGRLVALKLMLRSDQPALADRFRQEAQVLASLNHPHIVTLYEFGETGQFRYFLLEYVEGPNLRTCLRHGSLDAALALAIATVLCDALAYAHGRGVVHRDIKPENILLSGGDEKLAAGGVRLTDFGLARFTTASDQQRLTDEQDRFGTAYYAAPEQCQQPRGVDQRADIYSLGVVLYEMLTGELPLGHYPPASSAAGVDPRVDAIIEKCLQNDPDARYQQVGELKQALQAVLQPVESSSAPVARKSMRVWVAACTAFVAVIALGLAATTFKPWGDKSQVAASDPSSTVEPAVDPTRDAPPEPNDAPPEQSPRPMPDVEPAQPITSEQGVSTATDSRTSGRVIVHGVNPGFGRPPSRFGFGRFSGPSIRSFDDALHSLVLQNGEDRVVTIFVDAIPDGGDRYLIQQVKQAAQASQMVATGTSPSMTAVLAPVANLDAVLKNIDFGKVAHVDRAARTIRVVADADRFPPPLKPLVDNPQAANFYQRNLEDLDSWDAERRRRAAELLRDAPPGEPRGKIASKLAGMLGSSDAPSKRAAVVALGNWATEKEIPALIAMLKDSDRSIWRATITSLGKTGQPQAAEALAGQFTMDPRTVGASLREMGPPAETTVMPFLQHDDENVRRAAIDVLRDVGTSLSVPPLRQIVERGGLNGLTARRAVEAIEKRQRDAANDSP